MKSFPNLIMPTFVFFLRHFAALANEVINSFVNFIAHSTFTVHLCFVILTLMKFVLMACSWAAMMSASVSLLMALLLNHLHLPSTTHSAVCLINWSCSTFSFQLSFRSFALRFLYSITVSFTSMSEFRAALSNRSLPSFT